MDSSRRLPLRPAFTVETTELSEGRQDPVSLTFFKKLSSLTSLSLYGPGIDTFKCTNHSPEILPALKLLQISTPRANYYEHSLSFWQERARMPGRMMLERFQLTFPMCAKGRPAFLQRKEVFAKTVVLDYMHPPDQDVEMEEDDSDETDDEETGESEDSGGEMDED
ncbi:hypothetical protein EV421DRAFT_1971363 [Armillaria borealis]|uniref:Uncharacterized protein n=1 Tax=Armillaria borealis TaxID=47425 RepID=A0AA39JD30_9AGAR|nr:hypothetical protein EV421DRAFT_1971363 [Armillaria borealis]